MFDLVQRLLWCYQPDSGFISFELLLCSHSFHEQTIKNNVREQMPFNYVCLRVAMCDFGDWGKLKVGVTEP